MAHLLLPLRLCLLQAVSPGSGTPPPCLAPRRGLSFPRRRLQCLAGPAAPPAPPPPPVPRWHAALSAAAGLYPAYVTAGAAVAAARPEAFQWFVAMAPGSYTFVLGFIMLAMGLTVELGEFLALLRERPLAILFGCAAQFTIMPAFGAIVSRMLGLPPSLSVGLILLGCCPGGTASNVLLKVVVAPVLLGSSVQSAFPLVVKAVAPFAPLLAVLASSLLACSVFSENFVRLRSTFVGASYGNGSLFSGDIRAVVMSVFLLHFAGFFVGYTAAAIGGFKERQRRAISIEVGMQNSSLGVVLATTHFSSPLVALPPALSAVIMNIMGSTLALVWQYVTPSDSKNESVVVPDA